MRLSRENRIWLALNCSLLLAVAVASDARRNGIGGMVGWFANIAGVALLHMDQPRAAISVFEFSQRVLPTSAAAAMNRANTMASLGDTAGAVAALTEIAGAIPDDARIYADRAYYFRKLGNREAAAADDQRAQVLDRIHVRKP